MSELTRTVAHEWCRPDWYSESGGQHMRPYGPLIAMPTSNGWIILTEVQEIISGPDIGKLVRRALTYDELQVVSR